LTTVSAMRGCTFAPLLFRLYPARCGHRGSASSQSGRVQCKHAAIFPVSAVGVLGLTIFICSPFRAGTWAATSSKVTTFRCICTTRCPHFNRAGSILLVWYQTVC
jgi:hypothetical protein